MMISGHLSRLVDPQFMKRFERLTRSGKWGCTEWAGVRRGGYGHVRFDGRYLLAHRVAWMLHHQREIPPEHVIDHLCCNKGCVNPEHLEAVTDADNARRVRRAADGWVPVGDREKWGTRRKRKGARCYPKPI